MPVKEFNKSVKAKLYDFTYTPFMSSMVIAWMILNHKYILIYMVSFDLDKKLDLLKKYDFSWHTQWVDIPYMQNIIAPILFGLFYTFLYPKISKKFYKYTLNEKKELKKVKQKIEELTPILEEDAKAIKADNYEKTKMILELEESISKIETKHMKAVEVIETKYNDKIKHIENKQQQDINELRKDIEKSYSQKINSQLQTYEDNYKNIEQEKNNLQNENDKLNKKNKYLQQYNPARKVLKKSDDRIEILKYFYTSNYKPMVWENALDGIVESTAIARPKVSKIINELINEKILYISAGLLMITDDGNSYLVSKFDNDKTS